ncbi:hypothetical protein BC831DRAFT_503580 [Entophlyctis helioformis]|nr:hypothetical protein BC831DRAFT_503580 [Entophlyctis helioformis]
MRVVLALLACLVRLAASAAPDPTPISPGVCVPAATVAPRGYPLNTIAPSCSETGECVCPPGTTLAPEVADYLPDLVDGPDGFASQAPSCTTTSVCDQPYPTFPPPLPPTCTDGCSIARHLETRLEQLGVVTGCLRTMRGKTNWACVLSKIEGTDIVGDPVVLSYLYEADKEVCGGYGLYAVCTERDTLRRVVADGERGMKCRSVTVCGSSKGPKSAMGLAGGRGGRMAQVDDGVPAPDETPSASAATSQSTSAAASAASAAAAPESVYSSDTAKAEAVGQKQTSDLKASGNGPTAMVSLVTIVLVLGMPIAFSCLAAGHRPPPHGPCRTSAPSSRRPLEPPTQRPVGSNTDRCTTGSTQGSSSTQGSYSNGQRASARAAGCCKGGCHAVCIYICIPSTAARQTLEAGDLVEIRRQGKTMIGVVVGSFGNTGVTTIMSNGHTVAHSTSDVFFVQPQWAFQPYFATVEAGSSAKPLPAGLSDHIAKKLLAAHIRPEITHFIGEFQRHVESLVASKKDALGSMYDKLMAASQPSKDAIESHSPHVTLSDAARHIFNVDQPSPAECFAVYQFMTKTGSRFVPADPATLPRRARSVCVRKRKPTELMPSSKLIRETEPAFGSTKTDYQSFLDKCRQRIMTFRSANAAAPASGPSAAATGGANASPKQEAVSAAEPFNEVDNFLLDMIVDSVASVSNFPSNERIFAQLHVLKRLNPLYSFYPTEAEVGVHAPWENVALHRPNKFGRNELLVGATAEQVTERTRMLGDELLKTDKFEYDSAGKLVLVPATTPASATPAPAAAQPLDPKPWSVADRFKANIVFNPAPHTSPFYQTDMVAEARVDFGAEDRVFVIDSPTAHELDDGFSLQDTPAGTWIHVHIADPTAVIPPGSDLALIAQMRGNSVYLPERHYPMLPDALARGRFDLDVSPCSLTFSARLGADGDIIDYRVAPAFCATRLLSTMRTLTALPADRPFWLNKYFEAVDQRPPVTKIDAKDTATLRRMHALTEQHLKWRLGNGAFVPDALAASVRVEPYPLPPTSRTSAPTAAPSIVLSPFDSQHLSPSHLLVSEMMIIAGRVAAKFCVDHGVSVPFRGQPPITSHVSSLSPSSPEAIASRLADQLLPYMPPAAWTMQPAGHSTMGLPDPLAPPKPGDSSMVGYVKATSPLRRYKDLLVHWQIKSVFAKQPSQQPFSPEGVEKLIQSLHSAERATRLLSAQSDRFWMLEWLRRREVLWQTGGLSETDSAAASLEMRVPAGHEMTRPLTYAMSRRDGAAAPMGNAASRPVVHVVVGNNVSIDAVGGGTRVFVNVVELGGQNAVLEMGPLGTASLDVQPGGVVACHVQSVDPSMGRLALVPARS